MLESHQQVTLFQQPILKQSIEILLPFLTNSVNYIIKNGEFPDN